MTELVLFGVFLACWLIWAAISFWRWLHSPIQLHRGYMIANMGDRPVQVIIAGQPPFTIKPGYSVCSVCSAPPSAPCPEPDPKK